MFKYHHLKNEMQRNQMTGTSSAGRRLRGRAAATTHLNYPELVGKDEQDAERYDVTDQEEIDMEEGAGGGSPVGELLLHDMAWYKPTQEQACQQCT